MQALRGVFLMPRERKMRAGERHRCAQQQGDDAVIESVQRRHCARARGGLSSSDQQQKTARDQRMLQPSRQAARDRAEQE